MVLCWEWFSCPCQSILSNAKVIFICHNWVGLLLELSESGARMLLNIPQCSGQHQKENVNTKIGKLYWPDPHHEGIFSVKWSRFHEDLKKGFKDVIYIILDSLRYIWLNQCKPSTAILRRRKDFWGAKYQVHEFAPAELPWTLSSHLPNEKKLSNRMDEVGETDSCKGIEDWGNAIEV